MDTEDGNIKSSRAPSVPPQEGIDSDPDFRCGIGSWHPEWLQRVATPRLFFFFFTLTGILEGAQYTYLVGILSTLEKRFTFDTKISGIILMSEEVTSVLLGSLLGYIASKTHKPRLLTAGMSTAALSGFIMALPYFFYGAGRLEKSVGLKTSRFFGVDAQFCDKDFNEAEESCSTSVTVPVVLTLVTANLIKGVATVTYYSIGTPYIDDIIKKKNSPSYLGTLFALRFFSPILGFLVSSLCLQYYEDPFYDPGFTPEDPRWIGAWWVGFIILTVLLTIFAAPMAVFPKRFPGIKLPTSLQKKNIEKPKSPLGHLKDMGRAMKRLGKNPILVCHYVGNILRLNGISGYYLLMPKYIETQFRQSASKASLYAGPASIFGMQLGIVLGGFAVRKFKPRPRVLTGSIVFAESFSIIALIICMFITCPYHQFSGASSTEGNALENECNKACLCTTEVYTPVCGPDGTSTYFSPCYAGCTDYNKSNDKQMYLDCKCVHDSTGEITLGDAKEGYCDSDCQWMVTYIVILSIGKMLTASATIPEALISLRCVDPEDKSLALGTLTGAISLLAFLPLPVVYGALTDSSCLVWEESCGKTGNCWIYDADKLRFLLHGVSATFIFLACIADVIVCIMSPRLKNLYEEDDEREKSAADDGVEQDGVVLEGVGNALGDSTTHINDKSNTAVA